MFETTEVRKQLVNKFAVKYGLDVSLVCALIHHESAWNTYAMRCEPLFFTRYIQPMLDKHTVRTMTEANSRATSWGLMQVMGEVAREMGFSGQFLAELCDPQIGIDFGCRKLQKCINSTSDVRAALLSYNGGGDQQYPGMVLQWKAQYGG